MSDITYTGQDHIYKNPYGTDVYIRPIEGQTLHVDHCIVNQGTGDTGSSLDNQILFNNDDDIVGSPDMTYIEGDTNISTVNTSYIRRTLSKNEEADNGFTDLQTNLGESGKTRYGAGVAMGEDGVDLWTFLQAPLNGTEGVVVFKNNIQTQVLNYGGLTCNVSDVYCACNEDASRFYYCDGSRTGGNDTNASMEYYTRTGDTFNFVAYIPDAKYVKASGNYYMYGTDQQTYFRLFRGLTQIALLGTTGTLQDKKLFDISVVSDTIGSIVLQSVNNLEFYRYSVISFGYTQMILNTNAIDLCIGGDLCAFITTSELKIYERDVYGGQYTLRNSFALTGLEKIRTNGIGIVVCGNGSLHQYLKYDSTWWEITTPLSSSGRAFDSVDMSATRFIYGSQYSDTTGSSRNYLVNQTYLNTKTAITLNNDNVEFLNNILVNNDLVINNDLTVLNNLIFNGFLNGYFQVSATACTSYNVFRTSTNGTASTPIYSTASNPSTGMYLSGTTVAFSASGNLVLSTNGTSTTSVPPFRYAGATATLAYTFTNDQDTGTYLHSNNVYGILTGGATAATFDQTHFVPYKPVRPLNNGTTVNPSYAWVNDPNSGMFLISPGNIGISTSQQTNIFFDRSHSIKIRGGFQTLILFRNTSNTADMGSITTNNITTFYNSSSDRRLKQNIRVMPTCGLDLIKQLRPVMYEWIADPKISSYGLIAQEVKEVLPEIVRGSDEDVNEDNSIKPMSIDYSKLVPHLICAIKTLNKNADLMRLRIKLLEDHVGF
jgi:hypothetical protein